MDDKNLIEDLEKFISDQQSLSFKFLVGQKIILKDIAVHFKRMNVNDFNKNVISTHNTDHLAQLYKAYNLVIEDCDDFSLLKDLLLHKRNQKCISSQ